MTSQRSGSFNIPTVDMGKLGVGGGEAVEEDWARLVVALDKAFADAACCYLVNHGITKQQVDAVYASSAAFFEQPVEVKMKNAVKHPRLTGYMAVDTERYGDAPDLHEGFLAKTADDLPDDGGDLSNLRPSVATLLDSSRSLSHTIITALSMALGKGREYLPSLHQHIRTDQNVSVMRLAHYPPVPPSTPHGSTRFAEHVDYTTITLVFQDSAGGLQVRDDEETWHDVPHVPGTILLMCGQFLQFYSLDKYQATMHRVIIPEEEVRRQLSRFSIIYFTHSDNHLPMWPLSADNRTQPPPTVKEYLAKVLTMPTYWDN